MNMAHDEIVTKNLMEELVDMKLDEIMYEAGMCMCEHCKADVKALALNHLPPKYVVTTGGDIITRVLNTTTQAQADLTAAVARAATLVKNKPRHPRKD